MDALYCGNQHNADMSLYRELTAYPAITRATDAKCLKVNKMEEEKKAFNTGVFLIILSILLLREYQDVSMFAMSGGLALVAACTKKGISRTALAIAALLFLIISIVSALSTPP